MKIKYFSAKNIVISIFAVVVAMLLFTLMTPTQTFKPEPNEDIYFNRINAKEQIKNTSQKIICSDCNKTDSNGKQGLWVEEDGYFRTEIYYKDGIRSGIYKEFNSRGELLISGEYINGRKSSIWYFYDKGHLDMTFENHAKNYDTIVHELDRAKYVPDYKCYFKSYYHNGNIKEEGWLLWNEGETPESDLSVQYGIWKSYDEKGELINVKEHAAVR